MITSKIIFYRHSFLLSLIVIIFLSGCTNPLGQEAGFAPGFHPGVTLSTDNSVLSVSAPTVFVGNTVNLTLQLNDNNGDPYTDSQDVVFSLSGGTSAGSIAAVTNMGNGLYSATFTGQTAGTSVVVSATASAQTITSTLPSLTVLSYIPSAVAITSDRPLEYYSVDLSTEIIPTFTATAVAAGGASPGGAGINPAVAGATAVIGGSAPALGGVTPVNSVPAVFNVGSAFSATITVSASLPVGATTACLIESPFSGVACLVPSFNILNTDLTASGNLTVRAYAANGGPSDYLLSNTLVVKRYKLEAVMSSITGSFLSANGTTEFAKIGSKLIFHAPDANSNSKLFVLDNNTITQLPNTCGGLCDDYPFKLTNFNNKVYFSASKTGGVAVTKLYSTDGVSVNQVTNTTANQASGDVTFGPVTYPLVFNNALYFSARNTSNYLKLYKLDNLNNLSQFGNTTNSAVIADFPNSFTLFNNEFYFSSAIANIIRKIYKTSDGIGITQISNTSNNQTLTDQPRYYAQVGNVLYFWAKNSNNAEKLFKFDGTNITQVSDTRNNQTISDIPTLGLLTPRMLAVLGSKVIFWATNSNGWNKLYVTDGTSVTQLSNTRGAQTTWDGTDFSLYGANNAVYFSALNSSNNNKLYKTDGLTVTQVSNTNNGSSDSVLILGVFDSELYFTSQNASWADNLYKTDGTNTVKVSDLNPGLTDFDHNNCSCYCSNPVFWADATEAYISMYSNYATCKETLFRIKKM